MTYITKADWKLFRERISDWQESYMDRLVKEYIVFLQSDKAASEKFWELEKRIKRDRKRPGVLIELDKSEMIWDLCGLIRDGVITTDDLDGFSEDCRETVEQLLNRQW